MRKTTRAEGTARTWTAPVASATAKNKLSAVHAVRHQWEKPPAVPSHSPCEHENSSSDINIFIPSSCTIARTWPSGESETDHAGRTSAWTCLALLINPPPRKGKSHFQPETWFRSSDDKFHIGDGGASFPIIAYKFSAYCRESSIAESFSSVDMSFDSSRSLGVSSAKLSGCHSACTKTSMQLFSPGSCIFSNPLAGRAGRGTRTGPR